VKMRKILLLTLVSIFALGLVLFAQKPAPPVPSPPQIPSESLTVKVLQIEIGPEGIVMKDKQGKILKIQHPTDIDLKKIDSILKATGKTKIEIERLKADLEELQDSDISEIMLEEHEGGGIVKFGQSVHIDLNEVVEGDVVCIGGSISIDGVVRGSAVSLGGQIIVSNTGMVEGDAVAVGGHVIKHPGGNIGGENVSLGFVPFPAFAFYRGAQLAFILLLFTISVFAAVISFSLVPKNVNKIKTKLERSFFKSLIIGTLGPLLFFIAFILLIVTVIGIPVAVLVLPLILVFATILGFAGISYHVGDKLRQNTRLNTQSPLGTILLGTTAAYFLLILWAILDFVMAWIPFLGGLHLLLLFLLGLAVLYLFATVGFGAALLSRLGTRPKDIPVTPAPPPQPATSAPATA